MKLHMEGLGLREQHCKASLCAADSFITSVGLYLVYNMGLATGKKLQGGLRAISPTKCKNEPPKIKKEPMKITINCNVKAGSMLQI